MAGQKVEGVIARGVSILKTKYDTMEVPTARPGWMIDEWLETVHEDLQEMIAEWQMGYHGNSFRKNLGESCSLYGGCEFQDVCTSDQPRKWLPMNFERRQWNPLTRQETPLGEDQ
jgi:hypothetical protein